MRGLCTLVEYNIRNLSKTLRTYLGQMHSVHVQDSSSLSNALGLVRCSVEIPNGLQHFR